MQNFHVIEFNSSRSTFQVLAHCFTKQDAKAVVKKVKNHFNYHGTPVEIISSYELGYLEAVA
jgi:hypothetical protein